MRQLFEKCLIKENTIKNKIIYHSVLRGVKYEKAIARKQRKTLARKKDLPNANSFLNTVSTTDTSNDIETKTDSVETMPGSNGRISEDSDHPNTTNYPFVKGCLTWARLESSPFWPSIIICDTNPAEDHEKKFQVQVFLSKPKLRS